MHMADALISPAVGGTMWIVTAGLIAYCARKLKQTIRDNLVPMMGVLGAFIFAAQMINFSIPGTGSSGHLGGGLILSVLLGPYAAFLVIASVLTVQAFFFADGGLLVLGCNIFNLGFYPAFIAYPFVYRMIYRDEYETSRTWISAIAAAIVGLQLGAFSVVLETKASGISDLPFGAFVLLMQPIHLAIGIVEGLATAAVIAFVTKARPEVIMDRPLREDMLSGPVARHACPSSARGVARLPYTVRHYNKAYPSTVNEVWPVLAGLSLAAMIIGGAVSWFASTRPDGLEWAIAKITGKEEISGSSDAVHRKLAAVQAKVAFLPDYDFNVNREKDGIATRLQRYAQYCGQASASPTGPEHVGPSPRSERGKLACHAFGVAKAAEPEWPAVTAGTSVSGIVGGLLTLALAGLVGFAFKARRAAI